jgi:hypothetical protein
VGDLYVDGRVSLSTKTGTTVQHLLRNPEKHHAKDSGFYPTLLILKKKKRTDAYEVTLLSVCL